MKTTLYLVRHGRTKWNEEGRVQGWSDVPLSRRGREEAREIAEKVKNVDFCAAYSSTLSRAHTTAKLMLSGRRGIKIIQHEDLREGGLTYEGMTWDEINRSDKYKEMKRADRYYKRYYEAVGGAESIHDVYKRVSKRLDTIAKKHPDETVVIVSHGLVMKTMALHMGLVTQENIEKLIIRNAYPHVVEYNHKNNNYRPIDFELEFYQNEQ